MSDRIVRKNQSTLPPLLKTFAIENWIFRLSCDLRLFFDRTLAFTLKTVYHALKLNMISVFIIALSWINVLAITIRAIHSVWKLDFADLLFVDIVGRILLLSCLEEVENLFVLYAFSKELVCRIFGILGTIFRWSLCDRREGTLDSFLFLVAE